MKQAILKIIRRFDIITVPILFLLILSTLLFFTLANSSGTYTFLPTVASKQPILLAIAGVLYLSSLIIPPQLLKKAPLVVGSQIILLILLALLFVAPTYANTHRWYTIGRFTLQPSEFFKITSLLSTVHWLHSKQKIHLALTITGIILIFMEPDLGMTLIILGTNLLVVLFWYALRYPRLLYALLNIAILLLSAALAATVSFLFILLGIIAVAWTLSKHREGILPTILILIVIISIPLAMLGLYYSPILKPYQKKRMAPVIEALTKGDIQALLNGAFINFHTRQARIAIGSGGLTGKGIANTTQSRLRFLPEVHTDFIYATISEIYGLIGALVVILAYLLIIGRLLHMAYRTAPLDTFTAFFIMGVAVYLIIEVLIGIGVNLALLPTKGTPLPFLSYGGSSLFAHSILIGSAISLYYNTNTSTPGTSALTLV